MLTSKLETESIFKWVLRAHTRLGWYAQYCKRRGLTYRQFVEELEEVRRDVMKTPDGVTMNPESNCALDMVRITAAWRVLKTHRLNCLYRDKR